MNEHRVPNAFLSGGPARTLAEEQRLCHLPDLEVPKVRIQCGNRYEHFEASPETAVIDGREVRVFVWSLRTYLAE